MQQQSTSTSNLQIKLITDARKLLEKVRSQQAISADSSFDSSFLFDAMAMPVESKESKEKEDLAFVMKEMERDVERNGDSARGGNIGSVGGGGSSFGGVDELDDILGSIDEEDQEEKGGEQEEHGGEHGGGGGGGGTETNERASERGSSEIQSSKRRNSNQHNHVGTGKSKSSLHSSGTISNHKPYEGGLPPRGPTKAATSKNDNGNSNNSKGGGTRRGENKSVENLQKENMKLKLENYELHEEMNDFEYKLYCLEHTLGIIEDVERSSQSSGSVNGNGDGNGNSGEMKVNENEMRRGSGREYAHHTHMSMNMNMNTKRPNPLVVKTTPITTSNTDDDSNKLSPITAMVADAMIDGSGIVRSNDVVRSNTPGRRAPPNTPDVVAKSKSQVQFQSQYQSLSQSQSQAQLLAQENEINLLRENNAKMVVAIKALAQATIAQTRKHYLYKKRHHMTKLMVVEETEKANQLMTEKEQIQNDFYQTRSEFLKEKDIREELSSELQLVAQKNNVLRRERKRDVEMKQKIIERLEYRDNDAMSVLSRLSQSSCFPILQTITEAGSSTSENRENIDTTTSTTAASSRSRSSRDKGIEKLVFKLISQLKKRDEKIAKLEKKLKITMQYLEGALELEVARQDAEIEAKKQSCKNETILEFEKIFM